VATPITDTLQSVAEPVQVATPITDTLQSVAEPVQVATPITDTLQSVAEPGQILGDPMQVARDTLSTPEVQQVAGNTLSTADPLQTANDTTQTINQALQTGTDPVQTGADAVQTAVNTAPPPADVVQPVANTVQPVNDAVQPVNDAVQPVADGAAGAVTGAGEGAVTGAGQAVTGAGQAVNSAADGSSVGGTAEKTIGSAHEALSGPGTADSIHGGVTPLTDESSALSDKLAGTDGMPDLGGAPGIPVHLPEDVALPGPQIVDTHEVTPGDVGLFGGGGLSPRLPDHHELLVGAGGAVAASAGLLMLARVALAARAAGPSAALSAQFFLANARQIPAFCGGVRENADRYISTAAAGIAEWGEASGARFSTVISTAAANPIETLHDGFLRGLGQPGPNGDKDDGASDTRLLMQLGMLLGTVYLAFLTVWFWATRLRWNPRM
jgi:hypothetical protein